MSKLLKFNQRAIQVDENTDNFSFGIIIENFGERSFLFDMVNDNGERIQFINLNEWRIYSISSHNYFTREVISFDYSDPTGSKQKIETGGRTINMEDNHGINGMAYLLKELLEHFHRISCFKDIESVIEKEEELNKENKYDKARLLNHLGMSTSL